MQKGTGLRQSRRNTIALVAVLQGPFTIVPVITGTVLAVTLGTLSGVVAWGLSDAHLATLLVSALLIGLSPVKAR